MPPSHRFICRSVIALAAALAVAGFAAPRQGPPLSNVEILIIRHGEKPDEGKELNPAGVARANAYVKYFENLKIDGKLVHFDHIFATAEGKNSDRERLTVEPLAKDLGLKVDDRFKNKNYGELATDVQTHRYGHELLICWHHGNIPALVSALQGDAAKLFPGGKWPSDHFDWIVRLHYDGQGRIQPNKTELIHEHLMPDDKPEVPMEAGRPCATEALTIGYATAQRLAPARRGVVARTASRP